MCRRSTGPQSCLRLPPWYSQFQHLRMLALTRELTDQNSRQTNFKDIHAGESVRELLHQIAEIAVILRKGVCIPIDVLEQASITHQLEERELAPDERNEVLSHMREALKVLILGSKSESSAYILHKRKGTYSSNGPFSISHVSSIHSLRIMGCSPRDTTPTTSVAQSSIFLGCQSQRSLSSAVIVSCSCFR